MRLTVIMLDTARTQSAIAHENEWVPYGRRTVHVELTPEQCDQLKPRNLTPHKKVDPILETVGEVFLEE